jgi:hypothetical protein
MPVAGSEDKAVHACPGSQAVQSFHNCATHKGASLPLATCALAIVLAESVACLLIPVPPPLQAGVAHPTTWREGL